MLLVPGASAIAADPTKAVVLPVATAAADGQSRVGRKSTDVWRPKSLPPRPLHAHNHFIRNAHKSSTQVGERDAPCSAVVRGSATIHDLWKRLNLGASLRMRLNLTGDAEPVTVVNLGAKWIDDKANVDIAWAFVQEASPPVRVIGFDPQQADRTSLVVASRLTRAQAAKVTIVHEFAQPPTIAHMLDKVHSVPRSPRKFALLKIDVDSVDGALAHAILRDFSPALVYAEFNAWTPLPLRFTALAPKAGRTATFFRGYRGFNTIWPCGGTSLAMWASIASEHGYQFVATDHHSNVLLIKKELAHHLGLKDCNVLHEAMYAGRETRLVEVSASTNHVLHGDNISAAAAIIERRCKENDTPYTLSTEDSCLCPPTQLQDDGLCRCDAPGTDIWVAVH